MGKQRSHITKFIAQNKLRQEFVPLLGGSMLIYPRRSLYITLLSLLAGMSETVVASLRWVWFVSCITTESAAENQFCQALTVYYILIWIHVAWIKVLLLAFCHFDKGTSEDQLSFKGVSCETSHFGICCSQIQRCSFYLLKSWGAHWASGKAKDLMSTHTRKFNIWGLGLNSMQGREAKHVKLA